MSEEYIIEQLVRRERFYGDTDQWDKWRDCYHPDSSKTHVDISWYKGQIDPFVERSRSLKPTGVGPVHTLTPIETVISSSNDRAYSISSAQITTRLEYSGSEYDLVAELRLVSRLEKVSTENGQGSGWKLVSLEGIYSKDRILPVFPLEPKSSTKKEMRHFGIENVQDPRESYKCLIWSIERKGIQVRRDLPGTDRPETVEKIMRSCEKWVEDHDNWVDDTETLCEA